MSDRAATEIKFNCLLAKTNESAEDISDGELRVIIRLNNFFSSLHALVHYADLTDETACEFEAGHFGGKDEAPISKC